MKCFFEQWFPRDGKNHTWTQALIIIVACLNSFTIGTLFAWTSPSIPILTSNSSYIDPVTIEEVSYFTIIPSLTAIFMSPVFGIIVDIIGRKKSLILIAVPHMLSWVLICLAEDIVPLYVSRVITGIADAAFFATLPMYIAEISVPSVRGSWGNLVTLNVYVGQVVINAVGSYFDIRTTGYICITVPILMLLLVGFLPESPYFLLMKGREEAARESLQTLRWRNNVEDELMKLTKDVQRQISESGTWKDLITIPSNRKALFVSVGLRSAQQLSGLGTFNMYTQYLFDQAGGHMSASTSAIVYTSTLTILITIAATVVDKFGRRRMMIFSSIGCAIAVAIEAIYFYIYQKTDLDVSHFRWVPLAGMLLYLLMCSSGLGILPTLMLGELFSASVKGKALCISNISFFLFVISVSKIFQAFSTQFGMYLPFCIFFVCCSLSTVFSYYFVPETKGKTLEEIQQSLRGEKSEWDYQEKI